jgi:glucosyl-3-phosphoglycerate synthase
MALTAADRWARTRTFHHSAFTCERVAAEREATISVCLPARNEAATIGPIVRDLMPLLERDAVDQIVVVDDSTDGTAEIAGALGAEVYDQSSLHPALGEVQGKGDAMWRALSVLDGDVVCYLDADSEEFGPHFALALAGAVACPGPVRFAKGFYRRPLRANGVTHASGGGRVTELCARPMLQRFFPELSQVSQPLAGEIAAARSLLTQLPFPCGYGVDVALLIDVWKRVGLEGMAQVDLDVRQNRHRPLKELGPMASAVLGSMTARLRGEGRLVGDEELLGACLERPPFTAPVTSRPVSVTRR